MRMMTLLATTALLCVGCGKSDTVPYEKPVFPVSGGVNFKGKPIKDASIRLHPISTTPDEMVVTPRGVADSGGRFDLTTYRKGDGAPSGEYQVSVSWVGPLDGLDEEEEDRLRERLPRKYTRPESSGITVSISEGMNELPEISLN
ncbi:MAG: hypothetical protein HON04_16475 [Planctomicrobium sp.]|jgi:hypothetical protein|nr:hypothetical protein [Planctomicrobium sp.]